MSTSNALTSMLVTPTLETLGQIEAPDRADLIPQFLLDTAVRGRTVIPVGGSGALLLGNPTEPDAIGLSTRRLNQIIDYQPTDMTLSVAAGATLTDVRAVIGVHGQALPIEAVDPDSTTIGGLIATALSGPRRYGGGTLRDVLIGISVAYPDGTIGKGGGLVVKNVSGYDMMRMHYGALGTLGVILSANFKVLPTIRDEFTAIWMLESLTEVILVVDALRTPAVRPTALIVKFDGSRWAVSARFEGRSGGLAAVAKRIDQQIGHSILLRDDESASHWQAVMTARALRPDVVRLRIGTLPSDAVAAAATVQTAVDCSGVIIEIEPGVGLTAVSWPHIDDRHSLAAIEAVREAFASSNTTILCAPDSVKRGIDIWGSEPESIAIMRRMKNEFDPLGVLNRHRFAGHI